MRTALGCLCAVVCLTVFGCNKDDAASKPISAGSFNLPRRPAFTESNFDSLLKEFDASIVADEPKIREFQVRHKWDREHGPLIPQGPEAVHWKPAFDELLEYRKQSVAQYRAHTNDPEAARKPAEEFLECYAEAAAWQRADWPAVHKLGEAAIAAGSNDPVVKAYHVRSRENSTKPKPAEQLLAYQAIQKSLPEKGDYPPPIVRMQLAAWAYLASETAQIPEAPFQLMRKLAFAEAARFLAVESGKIMPDVLKNTATMALRFNAAAEDQRTELLHACLFEKGIDSWILNMLAGTYYEKLAWQHRGGGFADTVSKEGWLKFEELMPKAAQHYAHAWLLHPEIPDGPAEMIMVAITGPGLGWSPTEWFHATVTAQFDFENAYQQYIWTLMPRWGGTHKQIAYLAKACIDTGRWDTTVPMMSLRALNSISKDDDPVERPGDNPAAAAIARVFIDGFVQATSQGEVQPSDYRDTLSRMTSLLIQGEDFETARKAFQISPDEEGGFWDVGRDVGFNYCRGLTEAMAGRESKLVISVHHYLTRPAVAHPTIAEIEEMRKRLEDAQRFDSNPKSQEFYGIAGQMLDQLQTYASGEWVNLTFEPSMVLWMTRAGHREIIDPFTLKLEASDDIKVIQARPLTRFAPPFIVEAEVKPGGSLSGEAFPGIVLGTRKWGDYQRLPMPSSMGAQKRLLAYFDYREVKQTQPLGIYFDPDPLPEDGFFPLSIRRYAKEQQMFGMHNRIMVDRSNQNPPSDFILFGEVGRHYSKEATFRNLRIRKAPPLISVTDTEDPANLPLLEQAVANFPDSPEELKTLALAHAEQGRPAPALELIAKAKAIYTKVIDVHRVEGLALAGQGRYAEAQKAFDEELRLFSYAKWSAVHLAWIYATAPDESLRDSRKAAQLMAACQPDLANYRTCWSYLLTEAAVAAEGGKMDDARRIAAEAAEAADSPFREAFVARVRKELDAGRAYRSPKTGEIPPPVALPKSKKPATPDPLRPSAA